MWQGTVQCPPKCLWHTSFDSQSSKDKLEVIEGWQNYGEWVQKNDYHKMKIVFITKKLHVFSYQVTMFENL